MSNNKFIINFLGIFKSLELFNEELMGQYRLGHQKYYINNNIRMYRKVGRSLCKAEKSLILEHYLGHIQGECKICEDPQDMLNCRICNYNTYEDAFCYLHKTDFNNRMTNIKKDLGLETIAHKWITVSPKKSSYKADMLRSLQATCKMYFTGDIPRATSIKWALELGSEGDQPHVHILCCPVAENSLKNFARDFTKLWKTVRPEKCDVNAFSNTKVAFNIQTIKRPEYIRARIEYLNNETKGITHHNPFDSEFMSQNGIDKYTFINM